MYPDPVSPVPTESGYNGQSLDRASSIGEIPYDANGFISNGYSDTNMNGGSAAVSPTPYDTNGYNGNEYTCYSENGSIINGNGSMISNENGGGYNENGYNGNERSGGQFVRRRLLPTIPRGETNCVTLFLQHS